MKYFLAIAAVGGFFAYESGVLDEALAGLSVPISPLSEIGCADLMQSAKGVTLEGGFGHSAQVIAIYDGTLVKQTAQRLECSYPVMLSNGRETNLQVAAFDDVNGDRFMTFEANLF